VGVGYGDGPKGTIPVPVLAATSGRGRSTALSSPRQMAERPTAPSSTDIPRRPQAKSAAAVRRLTGQTRHLRLFSPGRLRGPQIEIWRSRLAASKIAGRRTVGADGLVEQRGAEDCEFGPMSRPAQRRLLASRAPEASRSACSSRRGLRLVAIVSSTKSNHFVDCGESPQDRVACREYRRGESSPGSKR
jgi:hypothetical protein